MSNVFRKWQSYERDVVPGGAPLIQREECRRAFYAGAWACFQLVMAGVEPASEEACETNLIALEEELRAIVSDLREVAR